MTETQTDQLTAPARNRRGAMPRFDTPIVPRNSISGRALVAVVAIMTFLAALTTGAVMLVNSAASDWQADVAREVSIQLRPVPGRDLDATVERAVALAKGIAGIAEVRAMSKEESARLLEPWLGSGLTLTELPVPRMIVVTLGSGPAPDLDQLRAALERDVPGASLDDHRGWIGRMRAMAGSADAAGIVILALMIAATMLSVSFATRGAMAANRPVIEVLHFVGAKNNFIAGHFQRHFLLLGFQGGTIGGGAAIALFALAGFITRAFSGTAGGDQTAALFGGFSIGIYGYAAMLALIVLIAAVTAWTSRHTVNRTLATID
jgi:cell division transport system permease protein